ncbi:MAG: chemotaxis protein CheW [Anaerolineae bacterium]|nr:chemotaxis protein CheW [Anaerolineae bacterium]
MTARRTPSAAQRAAEQNQRILEERARLLAAPLMPDATAPQGLEVVAFRLGAEHYAVPAHLAQETQPLCAHHWCRVPAVPPFITGILNLRGRIISIFHLAAFHGLPAHPPTPSAHVLLVRGGEEMELALLSDDTPRLLTIDPHTLQPPPAAPARPYLRGVTQDMLILLDLEQLLADPRLVVDDDQDQSRSYGSP